VAAHRLEGAPAPGAVLLDRVGASIDPSRLAGTLRPPEQQLVEIAKAIGADARIVLMDEPTASLTDAEVLRLMAVIKTLRDAVPESSTSRTVSRKCSRSRIA
jgi:ABC-type sugar transport system ATPase subunit